LVSARSAIVIDSQRSSAGISQGAGAAPSASADVEAVDGARSVRERDQRQRQVRAAETRLLYQNANTGSAVTVVIACLLAYALWDLVPRASVSAWLAWTVLVSAARFVLAYRYQQANPGDAENGRWNRAFVVGVALAAAGWGVGALVLYPSGRPMSEVLVVFAIGGMMLGGASLLAARPEAFLMFLLPTGFLTALRVASEGDLDHLIMGFLGAVFTLATAVTTWRLHRAIETSFMLRFDNQDLIESLQTAKHNAEMLNRDLELRVGDRTAKLTAADQRKDRFLATLAHELRNPLASIRFALEALKVETSPTSAARAREVMDRQVGQLVRLVDDLLDVSRITADKIHLRREPLDLARVVATAVESIAPLAAAADQTLDVRLPPTPVWVDGDGTRLVQVVVNILNNASKFTPPGGRISLTAESEPGSAVLRVRDTGVGISADVLPRVFDMFHQEDPSLDGPTGGLGIGLTLARRLVEMHDGEIDIRSAGTGQGTEVEIRVPATAAPAASAVARDAALVAAPHNLRVLIVEDNRDAAEMLRLLVSLYGHTTLVAHDGAAALSAAIRFAPDVIFLDIGLPVMNGYEVARTLRGMPQFNHVLIAAVSGWGQEEDRRKARDAGCDSHFTKPLSPDTLEELLASTAQRVMQGLPAAGTPRTRAGDGGEGF
jgi:signal transduction histidine kinase/CheY-like chemotaxis protein